MAYHKIPRKFDCPGIVDDLKNRLLYSDDIDSNAINIIADIIGTSKRTVYAVLDGDIKLSLDFLHAATIATDGDPEITKYLEPEGFRMKKIGETIAPDKATLAEECLDDVPALAKFHAVLTVPDVKLYQVELARNAVIAELEQNVNKWNADRDSQKGEVQCR